MTDQSTRWRRPLSYGLAGVLAAGTIGFAVAAPGQSVSEVPPESTSIWVLNRDGGQYAQVNMAIDELGTPQSVENPNNIAQYGDETIVFGSQYAKAAHITLSTPQDLSDGQSSDGFSDTPDGTQSVAIHGDSLAYVTAEGVVYTGQISSGGQGIPVAFDDEEKSDFLPTAIAFSPDGDVVAYSPSSGEIRQISHDDGSVSTIAEGVEVAEGDALP